MQMFHMFPAPTVVPRRKLPKSFDSVRVQKCYFFWHSHENVVGASVGYLEEDLSRLPYSSHMR